MGSLVVVLVINLSVGCGGNYEFKDSTIEDVNIDIRFNTICNNFVCSSINNIPFKTKIFYLAKAHRVLEHINTITNGLCELVRVSKYQDIKQDGFFNPSNYCHYDHKYFVWFKYYLPLNSIVGRLIKFILGFKYIRWLSWFIHKRINKV